MVRTLAASVEAAALGHRDREQPAIVPAVTISEIPALFNTERGGASFTGLCARFCGGTEQCGAMPIDTPRSFVLQQTWPKAFLGAPLRTTFPAPGSGVANGACIWCWVYGLDSAFLCLRIAASNLPVYLADFPAQFPVATLCPKCGSISIAVSSSVKAVQCCADQHRIDPCRYRSWLGEGPQFAPRLGDPLEGKLTATLFSSSTRISEEPS